MRYCMPPDPNTRTPCFRPPPGACDTHFHIFGPPEEFPFAATREYTPPAAPLEHYRLMASVIGVERGVVVQPSVHGLDVRVTLDAIAKSEGRFLGVARIDDQTANDELKRLKDAGIRGVRFNLLDRPRGNVELDVFERAVEKAAAIGWSVDLHIDPRNLLAHERRIRALPGPVVIDHMARIDPGAGPSQPAFQLLLDLLKDSRFWVKVTGADKLCRTRVHDYFGLPFIDVIPYARAVIAAAPDRVLWGTDWPHSNHFTPGKTPNDGDLVDLLAEFAPDEPTRNRILVENPARLYGFG
ncbi:MAG TPA: amidohydrolase family protein [candidate division Zixibacteria bacterium]|nr:amidohydrolase family protein [candidate division Zixibacteria bacterium]